MKNSFKGFGLLVLISGIMSCNIFKDTQKVEGVDEVVNLDTVEVTPYNKIEPYQGSEKRINDILHTKLEVSFNWDSTYLYGKATLLIKPHFYPTDSLILDAKGFQIHEVSLLDSIGKRSPLEYTYDSSFLKIDLNRIYERTDTFEVFIDYTSMPNKLKTEGSSAIRSDKGLYFINPDGSDPNKPKQIWTQGETEASSAWFPTIDAPNEKTTQEIYITVDSNFVTLSNGKLMFQTENEDGTRTDYWKQELPHAPYLFMMAIGEFAVVKDEWKGKPVHYYVEPKYKEFARDIYPNTVEMLEFFSQKFGYEFPWDKYHQVVVRDYVSGAMENTGAVIFGEFIQGDGRFLVDNAAEDIVSHELVHHWFGDLVTCESWSNLPLNESFATYGSYLWNEHKYGKDEADLGGMRDFSVYLRSSDINKKKLIRFEYKNRMEMFDAHSYQKGGRILHLLRHYLGDEAFFESLKHYLHKKAFQPAEVHDLRLSFEAISGEDLNWFFNQWFLAAGHPEIKVEKTYDDSTKVLTVELKQSQSGKDVPEIFELYTTIGIADEAGNYKVHPVHIVEKEQTFEFEMSASPILVNLDVDKVLVAEIDQAIDREDAITLFNMASNYMDKRKAVDLLKFDKSEAGLDIIESTLKADFWALRDRGLKNMRKLAKQRPESSFELVKEMAKNDEKSTVRASAIASLAKYFEDKVSLELLKESTKDTSFRVVSQALSALFEKDEAEGIKIAERLEEEENSILTSTIADIYAKEGSAKRMKFFKEKIELASGFAKFPILSTFSEYLQKQDLPTIEAQIPYLKEVIENADFWFIKTIPLNALVNFKETSKQQIEENQKKMEGEIDAASKAELEQENLKHKKIISKVIETLKEIKAEEDNENLLRIIENGLN